MWCHSLWDKSNSSNPKIRFDYPGCAVTKQVDHQPVVLIRSISYIVLCNVGCTLCGKAQNKRWDKTRMSSLLAAGPAYLIEAKNDYPGCDVTKQVDHQPVVLIRSVSYVVLCNVDCTLCGTAKNKRCHEARKSSLLAAGPAYLIEAKDDYPGCAVTKQVDHQPVVLIRSISYIVLCNVGCTLCGKAQNKRWDKTRMSSLLAAGPAYLIEAKNDYPGCDVTKQVDHQPVALIRSVSYVVLCNVGCALCGKAQNKRWNKTRKSSL